MDLTEKQIGDFLLALDEIVSAEGNWEDKRAAIYRGCVGTDETNLEEFLSWFDHPTKDKA